MTDIKTLTQQQQEDTFKKYEKLWKKIRDLIRSITKNSDNYDEKHTKK